MPLADVLYCTVRVSSQRNVDGAEEEVSHTLSLLAVSQALPRECRPTPSSECANHPSSLLSRP